MTWTSAARLLKANSIAPAHGWDATLRKLAPTGSLEDGSSPMMAIGPLEDAYVEHLLCGEKFTKLYPVDTTTRATLQVRIASEPIAESAAQRAYPYALTRSELDAADGSLDVVRIESNGDGVGMVLSSVFWIKKREEVGFDAFTDPSDMKGRYEEVVGLVRKPVQLFHVIWMPHDRNYLEVRVDFPRGIAEADVHGIHSILKSRINEWGVVALNQPVNLFPAVKPFYDDPTEGTVTQMTFQTTTGGIKDEKMPRRRLDADDQRVEPYHVAGKTAIADIAIYRITVEWGHKVDDVIYQPSVSLAASGPAGGQGRAPVISGALIKNCIRAADYEFVIERLGAKAQLDGAAAA